MEKDTKSFNSGKDEVQEPAIRFLVESALRTVILDKSNSKPSNRQEWVSYLSEALMSESDTPYQSVLSSLMANGVSSEEILQRYVPDAARYLGELWVSDKASFVDVTIGAARLQKMFRGRKSESRSDWMGRSTPLGHSVLMVIPKFEGHSLGAFVAADNLRRHGLWVHMGISLEGPELVEMTKANRFSMLGITLSTPNSIEKASELVDFLRKSVDHVPPIVIGGRAVDLDKDAVKRSGADHVAKTAREAIEKCGLPTVSQSVGFDQFC